MKIGRTLVLQSWEVQEEILNLAEENIMVVSHGDILSIFCDVVKD